MGLRAVNRGLAATAVGLVIATACGDDESSGTGTTGPSGAGGGAGTPAAWAGQAGNEAGSVGGSAAAGPPGAGTSGASGAGGVAAGVGGGGAAGLAGSSGVGASAGAAGLAGMAGSNSCGPVPPESTCAPCSTDSPAGPPAKAVEKFKCRATTEKQCCSQLEATSQGTDYDGLRLCRLDCNSSKGKGTVEAFSCMNACLAAHSEGRAAEVALVTCMSAFQMDTCDWPKGTVWEVDGFCHSGLSTALSPYVAETVIPIACEQCAFSCCGSYLECVHDTDCLPCLLGGGAGCDANVKLKAFQACAAPACQGKGCSLFP